MRSVELAGAVAFGADRFDEAAVLVVLHDSGVGVAIGNEDIAGGVPGDIGGPAEAVGVGGGGGVFGGGVARKPPPNSIRRPMVMATRPSGVNLMTMSVPSSTTQILSCGSTRTAWAIWKPYSPLPISRIKLPLGSNSKRREASPPRVYTKTSPLELRATPMPSPR